MIDNEKLILKQAYNNYAEHRDQTQMEPWKFEERASFPIVASEEERFNRGWKRLMSPLPRERLSQK
jgi:hypothetical protein